MTTNLINKKVMNVNESITLRVTILAKTAYSFPLCARKYLISCTSNLKSGVIPPWLEKF